MLLPYSTVLIFAFFAGPNGLLAVHAYEDETLTNRLQEFVANQQPVSENFAHPMKHSRRWGTRTPKLERGLSRDDRVRVRRVSSVVTIPECLALLTKSDRNSRPVPSSPRRSQPRLHQQRLALRLETLTRRSIKPEWVGPLIPVRIGMNTYQIQDLLWRGAAEVTGCPSDWLAALLVGEFHQPWMITVQQGSLPCERQDVRLELGYRPRYTTR